MRIGLIRHFPVEEKFPMGWRTAAELQAWRERYELSPATVGAFDLGGGAWQACLSSDLPRASFTARTVFPGAITYLDLLREGKFDLFQTGRLRMPVKAWEWLLRLAWLTGHRSQRACRDDFFRRVQTVADRLSASEQDTLVVTHAGMIIHLSAELRRRGFVGPKLRLPKHAKTYVYERSEKRGARSGQREARGAVGGDGRRRLCVGQASVPVTGFVVRTA